MATKKKTVPEKVGIIDTIIAVLEKATEKNPVTAKQILARLVKKFPDRRPEAMAKTISCQVPNRLWPDKEIEVSSNGERPAAYWIE